MAALALGLIAMACDDSDNGNPDGPVAGSGGRGGSSGSGGTGGTGGSGGSGGSATGGTGGVKMDAKAPDTGGGDKPRDTGGATDGKAPDSGGADRAADTGGTSWTAPCDNPKPGVPSGDFCTQYNTACGFGAAMGRVVADSFDNATACATRYDTYNATQKGCAAYHLCVASQTGMQATHCPHPAQAAGPCTLPAR